MKKKRKTGYQLMFIICMSLLALIWVSLLLGGSEAQLSVFFNQGSLFFSDFVYGWTADKDPYNWVSGSLDNAGNLCYPPLAYLVLYPFNNLQLQYSPLIIGLLFYSFFFLAGFLVIFNSVKANKSRFRFMITLMLFFSGVFLYSFERGNIIIVSAMTALFFLFEYDNEDRVIREMSYIALAVSAGLKMYPAILGVLIIRSGRYKEAVHALVYGVVAFFLPFFFFEGGIHNIPILIRNLKLFGEQYKYMHHPTFNFKYFASAVTDESVREKIYSVFIVVDKIIVILSVFATFLCKKKWRAVLLISVSMVFCSIHSGLYMGLFFFAGIVYFLNEAKTNSFNSLIFTCILLVLNPLQIVNGTHNYTNAMTNIGASVIVALLLISTYFSFFKNKIFYRKAVKLKERENG